MRVASASSSAGYGLEGIEWKPALVQRPAHSIDLFSPTLNGAVQAGRCRFAINLNAFADKRMRRWKWNGAQIVMQTAPDLQLAPTPDFAGVVSGFTIDDDNGVLSLDCVVDIAFLNRPLLTGKFEGGGGLDGEPEKRGTLKPAGFGACENIPVEWFDTTNWIGMLDGYGNTLAITRLMEGLNDFGPSVGNYASYSDLKYAIENDDVPPGRWATCIAQGLVGLGAPPVKPITVNATFGSNRLGAMVKRILTVHAGIGIANIDVGTFDQFDVSIDKPVHFWTADQRNVRELLEAIAASINSSPLITGQGLITMTRAVGGDPALTLDKSGATKPRVLGSRAVAPEAPVWRVSARVARPASTIEFRDINYEDDLIDRGAWSVSRTYRAGHYVWLSDKSSWLYINETPTSGNAPPAWPIEQNAYWRNLTPPSTASTLTYADGTPLENLKPAEAAATLGARAGVNLRDNSNVVVSDPAFKNSYLSLSSGGQFLGGGGGGLTLPGVEEQFAANIANFRITISGASLNGIGTGSGTAVANVAISIAADGSLLGAAGGQVQLVALGFTGDTNATFGASFFTNLAGIPFTQMGVNYFPMEDWRAGGVLTDAALALSYNSGAANDLIMGLGPGGSEEALLSMVANASNAGPGGGFDWKNFTAERGFDAKASYRFSIWVNRAPGANGGIYFGCRNDGGTVDLIGDYASNPYFWAGGIPTPDKWYLIVGYLHGQDSAQANQSGISGLYDPETGERIQAGSDFKIAPGATVQGMRAYQYYADPGSKSYFARPRIEAITEATPSLASLMSRGALFNRAISITGGALSGIGTGSGTLIANALLSLSSGGQLFGGGGGGLTLTGVEAQFAVNIANTSIYFSGGNLLGIGAGNGTAAANSLVSLSSGGQLAGAGGGGLTLSGVQTQFGVTISNSAIGVDGSGALQGIGDGNGAVVSNLKITISGSVILGIGAGAGTAVVNASMSLSSDGRFFGGGGGQVTLPGLGFEGENNADLTVVMSPTNFVVEIACDYLGEPKADQLPRTVTFAMIAGGGTDVTASSAWNATKVSGTVGFNAMAAGSGDLTITSIASDARIKAAGTYNGKERNGFVDVKRKLDAPPTGATGTSDSNAINASSIGTTYGVIGNRLTLRAGNNGQIGVYYSASFTKQQTGSTSGYGKFRWRIVGGTYADIPGSEAQATDFAVFNAEPGAISVSGSLGGLTPGAYYEIEPMFRTTLGSVNISGNQNGTAS